MNQCDECHLNAKVEELELLLFAVVRNRAIAPIGYRMGKTEAEITAKTYETLEAIKMIVDRQKMRELMKLRVEGGKKDE